MQTFDVAIIGAGAAGLFAAGICGQGGMRVLLLDHAPKLAEKIRISGGGRCNFTNREATPAQFLSQNPDFCRSALAGYTPQDFIALVKRYGIAWHEKHRGQLFCDDSSEAIIRMLLAECEAGGVERRQPCTVSTIRRTDTGFELDCSGEAIAASKLVIATGGLPVPKIGASDFGLRWAQRFGHRIVAPRPALVPLTFDAQAWAPFAELAGLSLEVDIRLSDPASGPPAAGANKKRREPAGRFTEDLLFTHRGLSGPAILQISSYWQAGQSLRLNLAPQIDLAEALLQAKHGSRKQAVNELAKHVPSRLAQTWLNAQAQQQSWPVNLPLADWRDADLGACAASLQSWTLTPNGSEGWRKAEVMAGGVDTRDLQSRSLESRLVSGLHFIGEVVDVTGWLGGYNFQWAWASAAACARALLATRPAPRPDSADR